MDHFYSLSAYRFVPEVVSSGPAGGQLVPQFPVSREDNEVIQLYTGQQSPSAPYIHARHVVRRTQTELRARFHARRCTDVLGFVEQKARGRGSVWTNSKALWMTATRPCCSDTLKLKDERTSLNIHSLIRQETDSAVLFMVCIFNDCKWWLLKSCREIKKYYQIGHLCTNGKSASGLICPKVMCLFINENFSLRQFSAVKDC